MQEYSEINIYIGLPKQINLNKKFFNIYTDIESKPLSDFGKELNKIKNNNYLLINGLPNIEENKKKYFYFYNDSRFNGLIPDENLFKRFPNISITSKFLIKSINLKKYLDLGLLVSNKAKISLIIRQGDISQIFKSIGNWIELINNIKIIGFAQNYLFENFHENKFLEDKGFLKTPSINYLEINYLKSIKENEKNNFIDKKKVKEKILAEINNKNTSRLNLIKEEANRALNYKKKNIFFALSFYLNNFEYDSKTFNPNTDLTKEIRLLDIGAEAVLILVNDSVIKVYRDKYYRLKNELQNNHEPEILLKLNSQFFPKPKDYGKTYMELDFLGKPIGPPMISLRNPSKSVRISGDLILSALNWLKEIKLYLKKNKISHNDIHMGNILYNNVLNQFTLIDFSFATFENKTGINYNKDLKNKSIPYLDDSFSIDLISNLLIQKLVFEYLKVNKIEENHTTEEIYNYLNKDENLNFNNKKFNYKNLSKLILNDTTSQKKKIIYINFSKKFSILGILLLKRNSKVFIVNEDVFCTRIYEAIRIKKGLKNLIPIKNDSFGDEIKNEINSENIVIISDIKNWIDYDFIDINFDKFIKEIKYKCKVIYICISVIDDISRYSKFIANYFSKIGYLCKKIEVSNHGIESKNFVLLRLNI